MSSADSIESLDNVSIASDASDCSTVNPSTGKRVLPQPKLTVSTFDSILQHQLSVLIPAVEDRTVKICFRIAKLGTYGAVT